MKKEIWKTIPKFQSYYEVSNFGRVRSLHRYIHHYLGGKRLYSGKIISPGVDKRYGHLLVRLCKKGKQYKIYLHRLVLLAFVGPCPKNMGTRHFPDKNPANCRLDNLQYGTHKENMRDKIIQTPKKESIQITK